MPSPDIGNSYYSFKRSEWNRDAHTVFAAPMPLIDPLIAPVEKQMRVFVAGDEVDYLDTTLFTRPTNYWTYERISAAPSTGVRCWGLQFTFDPVFEGAGGDPQIAHVAIWDENGDQMTDLDETYSDDFDADVWTTDRTTGHMGSGPGSQSARVKFPTPRIVTRVGWGNAPDGEAGQDTVENMRIRANVGTPDDPSWVVIGDNTVDAVINAVSHTAGQELDTSDYPAMSNPIDVDNAELLEFTTTAKGINGTALNATYTEITLSTALALQSDRIVMLRETRQDRPWVKPTKSAHAYPDQFMVYFDQIRYIVQELCELPTVSGWLSIGMADLEFNDYTGGSQAQFHLNGSGTTFSYADVELLDTIPGAQLDDRHQLVVESGDKSNGTSTVWTALTYNASPADETQYSVDSSAKTITLGASETLDIRIRRNTLVDDWWYDPRTGQPGWNSLAINTMQRQARFMIEEACLLPSWYIESPLSNSIFPRGWNWFVFVGTNNVWVIPGSVWGGGGEVIIFVNNVEIPEGSGYTIEWPAINLVVPPTEGVVVGVGGGGWGGNGMGGGDDDEETGPPANNGGQEMPNIEWPGLNFPAGLNWTIAIGATNELHLSSGAWEGGTTVSFSQGNAGQSPYDTNPMRIQFTVTGTGVSDGAGGDLAVGASEVWYLNRHCDGTFRRVASAVDADGNGTFESSAEGSAALGCLQPAGATAILDIWANNAPTVTNSSHPYLRMFNALRNINGLANGEAINAPFMQQWAELVSQSINAADEGVVSESGFSSAQFEQYVDPDQEFTDFDIPAP